MCDTGRLDILSDQTDDIDDGTLDRLFLKTLRVFYVTKPSTKPPPQISFVTSKLFLPVRTGEGSFESMSQTMYRIEAWLKVTGLYILQMLFLFGPILTTSLPHKYNVAVTFNTTLDFRFNRVSIKTHSLVEGSHSVWSGVSYSGKQSFGFLN